MPAARYRILGLWADLQGRFGLWPLAREGNLIDWARVNDLRSEIGENDFLEVVAMFLEEADEAVGRLAGPFELSQVEGQLHFLKGAALSLGLTDLAALCQAGERSAAMGNPGAVDLAQVADLYHTSRQILTVGLSQPSAR